MDIRTRPLPNGLTVIRDYASGLEATADPTGAFRFGCHPVWQAWQAQAAEVTRPPK